MCLCFCNSFKAVQTINYYVSTSLQQFQKLVHFLFLSRTMQAHAHACPKDSTTMEATARWLLDLKHRTHAVILNTKKCHEVVMIDLQALLFCCRVPIMVWSWTRAVSYSNKRISYCIAHIISALKFSVSTPTVPGHSSFSFGKLVAKNDMYRYTCNH